MQNYGSMYFTAVVTWQNITCSTQKTPYADLIIGICSEAMGQMSLYLLLFSKLWSVLNEGFPKAVLYFSSFCL